MLPAFVLLAIISQSDMSDLGDIYIFGSWQFVCGSL
jgi:hypothetical protein